ncbi:MAG TPA: ankyrin repeat domain-containing protein, partial [Flavitalea sp.]|nr:ankyrin repeat domain-containing protein [Flavitalea sp.]
FSKPLSGVDDSMNSYLNWVETANNLAADSNFELSSTYNYGGESLLHVAVKSGHLSMVKLLLENGASINIQDESGNTPLHYAAANGKKDTVKYLLEKGVDSALVNVKEQKAIDYSIVKGFNEITELILKFAANPTSSENKTDSVSSANTGSRKQALLDLKELFDAGILTQQEFDEQKKKILS